MQQAGGLSNNGGVRITPGSSSLMNNPAVTHAGGSALSTPHTGPSVPNRLSQVSPSAQGMPRNLSQMQLGSSAYHPSAPSYHPSAPSMRSMPSGFGGAGLGGAGRGAPAMMGGGGGMRMGGGGGGARMGGGGGGHGGGGHGGGHR
jgi:hypothetical protein